MQKHFLLPSSLYHDSGSSLSSSSFAQSLATQLLWVINQIGFIRNDKINGEVNYPAKRNILRFTQRIGTDWMSAKSFGSEKCLFGSWIQRAVIARDEKPEVRANGQRKGTKKRIENCLALTTCYWFNARYAKRRQTYWMIYSNSIKTDSNSFARSHSYILQTTYNNNKIINESMRVRWKSMLNADDHWSPIQKSLFLWRKKIEQK